MQNTEGKRIDMSGKRVFDLDSERFVKEDQGDDDDDEEAGVENHEIEEEEEEEGREEEIVLFGRPVTDEGSSIIEQAIDRALHDDVFGRPSKSATATTTTTHFSRDVKINKALAAETDAARHKLVPIGTARAIAKGRAAFGLSQRQLAARLSMDVRTIADIESGTAVLNPHDVRRIRIFLGLPK